MNWSDTIADAHKCSVLCFKTGTVHFIDAAITDLLKFAFIVRNKVLWKTNFAFITVQLLLDLNDKQKDKWDLHGTKSFNLRTFFYQICSFVNHHLQDKIVTEFNKCLHWCNWFSIDVHCGKGCYYADKHCISL